uniref:Uncharacterized protein n=1 Tax=Cucumis melo TaxID=3656 RepID=A0A9I9DRG8_CUCME
MDSTQSFKQSKGQLDQVNHKETDAISDRSNSSSSCTSDLSQDSAVSSIFQSDPPVLQSKSDVAEPLGAVQTVENQSAGSLSRIQSSSRGSSHIRLSGALGNHDPNRIPVSIFSGRPSNPMEWSTASNESLFSIHVGNNSFSREHFNFFKSGELLMNPNSSQTLSNLPPFVEPLRADSKSEITVKTSADPVTSASTAPPISPTSSHNVADHKKEVTTTMDELRGRQSVSNDSMNSSHWQVKVQHQKQLALFQQTPVQHHTNSHQSCNRRSGNQQSINCQNFSLHLRLPHLQPRIQAQAGFPVSLGVDADDEISACVDYTTCSTHITTEKSYRRW